MKNEPIHLKLPAGATAMSLALDQTCEMLKGLGIPDADIDQARKESERIGNDAPLKRLGLARLGF